MARFLLMCLALLCLVLSAASMYVILDAVSP